ncbi:MAG: PaaI family thioesterase [Alphaproteobacteria bacterium]
MNGASFEPPEDGVDDAPPPGFVRSTFRGPFTTWNGPFYHRVDPDGFAHGFRARPRHCNGHGIVHGGLLTAVLDGVLAAAVWRETRRRMVTIRLTSDFLAMARPGDWVEGTAHVTRAAREIAFAEGRIHVEGRDVLTGSGVFKLMRARRE